MKFVRLLAVILSMALATYGPQLAKAEPVVRETYEQWAIAM